VSDPPLPAGWLALRSHTPARIALGRAGCGLPTAPHLAFQAAHARARDAVQAALDVPALCFAIASRGFETIAAVSAAASRQAYLRMPDLGRTLGEESRAQLSQPMVVPDVVIVVGDGLSSVAVERNAVPVLEGLGPRLSDMGLRLAPVIVATHARVALADEIGELLQARLAVIMIGERPGLSAADSLGMYLTFAPWRGRVDSERNCISNIHAAGMTSEAAAARAAELIRSMLAHGASGVQLTSRALARVPS
jgi:ethanolamine ammonia-lyase small subunit